MGFIVNLIICIAINTQIASHTECTYSSPQCAAVSIAQNFCFTLSLLSLRADPLLFVKTCNIGGSLASSD